MGKGSGVESYFCPLRFIITKAPTSLYFVYKKNMLYLAVGLYCRIG